MYHNPPPGQFIKEWLRENQKNQVFLAQALHVKEPFISKIIKGKAHVTPKIALGLERVTGVPADTWSGYEIAHELERARRSRD